MLASNGQAREECLAVLDACFGVPRSRFAAVRFAETADGEIWVSSAAGADDIATRRPVGLRAFRRTPSGLKPTSVFLVTIGASITRSLVLLDAASLRLLLLGRRLPCSVEPGYVALSHDGAVVGCGLVADGLVHCLIPVGRRRDLLGILEVSGEPEGAEV